MIAIPFTPNDFVRGHTITLIGPGDIPENYGPYYQFRVEDERELWRTFRSKSLLRAYSVAKLNGAKEINIIPIESGSYSGFYTARNIIEMSRGDIIVPVGYENDQRINTLIAELCIIKTNVGNPSYCIQSVIKDYNDLPRRDFINSEYGEYANIFTAGMYCPGYGNFSIGVSQYDVDNIYGGESNTIGVSSAALAGLISSLDLNESATNKVIYGITPIESIDKDKLETITNTGHCSIYRDGFNNFRVSRAVTYQYGSDSGEYLKYRHLRPIRILHYSAGYVADQLDFLIGEGYSRQMVNAVLTAALDALVKNKIIVNYNYSFDAIHCADNSVELEVVINVGIYEEIGTLSIKFRRKL